MSNNEPSQTQAFAWPGARVRRSAVAMDEAGLVFGGIYRLLSRDADKRLAIDADAARVLAFLSIAYRQPVDHVDLVFRQSSK